jgi:hypothetical protein
MSCCEDLERMVELDFVRVTPITKISGRIVTEIDTDYFFIAGEGRPSYVGMNYCPFCGRVLSRGLWNLEKKKQ